MQDASHSLYPAQCGPWHWAGEKSLPNYHSARWHSMAFIALAPVLCASNQASLPPFLASYLIPPFFPTGLRSCTETSNETRAILTCSKTRKALSVYVLSCVDLLLLRMDFALLRSLECCIFWIVTWTSHQSDASAHIHPGDKGWPCNWAKESWWGCLDPCHCTFFHHAEIKCSGVSRRLELQWMPSNLDFDLGGIYVLV